MIKWIKKTWDWFDKKKTAIGTVTLVVAEVVPDPTVKAVLTGIGILFGGVGVIHKVSKNDLGQGLGFSKDVRD